MTKENKADFVYGRFIFHSKYKITESCVAVKISVNDFYAEVDKGIKLQSQKFLPALMVEFSELKSKEAALIKPVQNIISKTAHKFLEVVNKL